MREHDIFVTIQGLIVLVAVAAALLPSFFGLGLDSSRTSARKINDIDRRHGPTATAENDLQAVLRAGCPPTDAADQKMPPTSVHARTADSASVVVVLTALGTEYDAVRALLGELTRWMHPAGTIFEIGVLDRTPGRIALAEIGTGNQAAAVITERAIAVFRPQAVLVVGIAGALHDDLELGSVVVATKVYGYHGGTDEIGGFQARPQAWDVDHALDQLAREVNRTGSWTRLRRGTNGQPPAVRFRPVAAGEVVLNSQLTPLADQLRTTYSDAAMIEMESAGTAKAAQLNRVPFLTVRGISDKADGKKYAAGRVEWRAVAAINAAAFAIAVARSMLASTSPMPVEPPGRRRQERNANGVPGSDYTPTVY
jgi:nucleoside phosphorylase